MTEGMTLEYSSPYVKCGFDSGKYRGVSLQQHSNLFVYSGTVLLKLHCLISRERRYLVFCFL